MITVQLPNTDGEPISVRGVQRYSGSADTQDGKRHLHLVVYESMEIDRQPGVRGRNAPEKRSYAFSVTYSSSWEHEEVHHHSASHIRDLGSLRMRMLDLDPARWMRGPKRVPDQKLRGMDYQIWADLLACWRGLIVSAMERLKGGV